METIKKVEIENELKNLQQKGWLTEIDNIINEFPENIEFTSPKAEDVFNAFKIGENGNIIEPEEVKVLIIGQDPYPEVERAHGLAFSFKENKEPNDSLLNIFKAIQAYKNKTNFNNLTINQINEIKGTKKNNYNDRWNTNLETWAKNNKILLLNTALTFESEDNPHFKYWKNFTKTIISKILTDNNNLVVFLWGVPAQQIFYNCTQDKLSLYLTPEELIKMQNNRLINKEKEIGYINNVKIFMTSHPCHKSAWRGFKQNAPKHFAACDEIFEKKRLKPIWKDFPEK